MVVGVDALGPADERAAHAVESGLLAELAYDCLGERLARLHATARDRPQPSSGSRTPTHEQQPRRRGGRSRRRRPRAHRAQCPSSGRCTTMARATSRTSRRSSSSRGCPEGRGRRCRCSPRAEHHASMRVHEAFADADVAGVRLDVDVVDDAERLRRRGAARRARPRTRSPRRRSRRRAPVDRRRRGRTRTTRRRARGRASRRAQIVAALRRRELGDRLLGQLGEAPDVGCGRRPSRLHQALCCSCATRLRIVRRARCAASY